MFTDLSYRSFLSTFYPSYFWTAIAIQLVLLFIITRHTPKSLIQFKWFMGNTCVFQILLIIIVCFAQFRVVSNQFPVELRCYGWCRFFEAHVGYILYQAMQTVSQMSYLSIVACFYLKFEAVRWVDLSRRRIKVIMMIIALPVLLTVVMETIMVFTVALPEEVREHYAELNHDVTIYSVVGITLKNIPGVINFGIVCAVSLCVPPIGLVIRRKILKFINSHLDKSSPLRKDQNRLFVTGLTIQAVSPLFFYVPVYALYFYCLIESEEILFQQYFMTIVPALPALFDPFVVLYFVAPYRRKMRICMRMERASTVAAMLRN